MKSIKKIGAVLLVLGLLIYPFGVLAQQTTQQGGTGTTSPSGILYGITNNLHLQTVGIGAGLSFLGGILSAIGSSFGYPFPGNATSTPITFNGGLSGALTGNASTATALQTGRTISITGDLAYTSPSFDGSSNVTAAGTLSTVNSNVGSFTNANITVNGKGLITAASNGTAGGVTSVTGTYPVISSGGTTPAISLAFGTTTSNTWAGTQTFTNQLTAVGGLTSNNQFNLSYSGPAMVYTNTGAGTDNKNWVFGAGPTTFQEYILNDLGSVSTQWLNVNRSGTTVSNIIFATGASPGTAALTLNSNQSLTIATTTAGCLNSSGTGLLYVNPCTSGTVTSVTATNPLFSSGGTTPNITTIFSTTTTFGLGNNGFLITGAAGIPFVAASSTLNLPNTALQNSSLTVNGQVISLGGSGTVTANTPNALTFNNSGSGAASGTTFNGGSAQTISYNTIGAQVAGSYATFGYLFPNQLGGFNATSTGVGFSGGFLSTASSTVNSTFTISPLATPAGTFLAADPTGKLIATTTPTGTNYWTLSGNNIFNNNNSGNGFVGVGSSTPWAQLSVNPNGITGPAFAVGSSTATNFVVLNNGNIGIGTTSPFALFSALTTSLTNNLAQWWGMSSVTGTTITVTLTGSGTFTKPAGLVSMTVTAIGGAGGGGSGSGGTGNGGTGAASSFTFNSGGNTILANGGTGGSGSTGGSGGSASGGDTNTTGNSGTSSAGGSAPNGGTGGSGTTGLGGTAPGGAGAPAADGGTGFGGGSGGYSFKTLTAAQIGTTETYVVGGGGGGMGPGGNGANGGNASGQYGGGGGASSAAGSNSGGSAGGAGANASGCSGASAANGSPGTGTNPGAGGTLNAGCGGGGGGGGFGSGAGGAGGLGGAGGSNQGGSGAGGGANGNGGAGGAGTSRNGTGGGAGGYIVLVETFASTNTAIPVLSIANFTAVDSVNTYNTPGFGIGTSSPQATLAVQSISGVTNFIISGFIGLVNYMFFAIDKNGHQFSGGPAPTCGTGCASVVGDDNNMRVTSATSVTTITTNFANTWVNPKTGVNVTPVCVATDESGGSTNVPASSTPQTVTITSSGLLTAKFIGVRCSASTSFTF